MKIIYDPVNGVKLPDGEIELTYQIMRQEALHSPFTVANFLFIDRVRVGIADGEINFRDVEIWLGDQEDFELNSYGGFEYQPDAFVHFASDYLARLTERAENTSRVREDRVVATPRARTGRARVTPPQFVIREEDIPGAYNPPRDSIREAIIDSIQPAAQSAIDEIIIRNLNRIHPEPIVQVSQRSLGGQLITTGITPTEYEEPIEYEGPDYEDEPDEWVDGYNPGEATEVNE